VPITLLLIGIFSFFSSPLPTKNHPLRFYSSESRDDLKKIFSLCIDSAKHSIHTSSFGYSDIEMLSLLKQKKASGIDVTLHQENTKKTRGIRHRKFLIIDEELVCISSVNLTLPSLTVHNNIALMLYDQNLARSMLENRFYETNQYSYYPLSSCGSLALDKVLFLIENAKKSVQVAMFTLTHPQIVHALIQASSRGVSVKIHLDKQSAKAASKKAYETLKNSGIEIFQNQGKQLFHHKCALIDEQILIFGSANWTKSAFEFNDEDLMVIKIDSHEHQKFFRRFFTSIQYT